jgi:hypothetical protein
MEVFESAWQRIIDEFLKPIETLKNMGDHAGTNNAPENDFGIIMSEPSINISERFEQREEIT